MAAFFARASAAAFANASGTPPVVAGGGLATLGADSSLAARADPNAPAKMSISVDASGKARVEGAASPELR